MNSTGGAVIHCVMTCTKGDAPKIIKLSGSYLPEIIQQHLALRLAGGCYASLYVGNLKGLWASFHTNMHCGFLTDYKGNWPKKIFFFKKKGGENETLLPYGNICLSELFVKRCLSGLDNTPPLSHTLFVHAWTGHINVSSSSQFICVDCNLR